MLKKIFVLSISTVMLLSEPSYAVSDKIIVNLPNFNVVLNGSQVSTATSQYPPILYKNITYLPMTYNDCRNMGLETKWSVGSGLVIEKTGVFAEYTGSVIQKRNAASYQAVIPDYKITVNGKLLDNRKEEFPVLTFRNITYLPLTWRFAVEEFNWNLQFDGKSGLVITAGQGNVKKLELPYAVKESTNIQVLDGYFYYSGKNGEKICIFRAPVQKPLETTVVYEVDPDDIGYSGFPMLGFFKMDGSVYFSYHTGGAVMGQDVYCRVTPQGTGEEVLSGYLDFRMVDADKVIVEYSVPPVPGNLYYQQAGQERLSIGNSKYLYGWIRGSDGGMTSGQNRNLLVQDGWVFINASLYDTVNNRTNQVWKVNLKTKEMLPVTHVPLKAYSIVDNTIYTLGEDSLLYKTSREGEPENKIISTPLSSYAISNDVIWYVALDNQGLYRQDAASAIHAMMTGYKFSGVQVENSYVIGTLSAGEDMGLVVFNGNGETIFKTSDDVLSASIDGNILVYKTADSMNMYRVELQ